MWRSHTFYVKFKVENERMHSCSWLNFYKSEAVTVGNINLSMSKLIRSPFHQQQPIKQMGSANPARCAEFRMRLLFWDSRFPFFNMAIKLFIFQLLSCSSHIPIHLPQLLKSSRFLILQLKTDILKLTAHEDVIVLS